MISLQEARSHVLDTVARLDAVVRPRAEVLGCVTASDLVAQEFIPPFHNTAMDGFAVQAADTVDATESAPRKLKVVDTLAAGANPRREVRAGEAIRIMTGAPMPPGADAVIMVELTETVAGGDTVMVHAQVPEGNHVRAAGDDLKPGDPVFHRGAVLTPGHLGVIASVGATGVEVYPRARVGVMSTGDELIDGPEPLGPGQIRDANRHTLLALLEQANAEPVDLGLIRDDEDAIAAALEHGAESCDAVLTSGGVSMGDFDYVKAVLSRIGEMRWMQIAIKPAKPMAFGTIGSTPIFGLPGNPVSSMVSFELFARPALLKMMGHTSLDRPTVQAIADEDLRRGPDGKVHFARVLASYGEDGRYHIRFSGGQGSHQLAAMANGNALAIVSDGEGIEAGGTVQVMLLGPT